MSLGGNGHLPTGWRQIPLREVIREAQGGFASGERDPKGIVQLRMNNVTRAGQLDWSSYIRVPADSATVRTYCLEPGDVLFNNTNSTELVGKAALFQSFKEPVVFSNHFTRLRPVPSQLMSQYLALWLLSEWQQGTFARICNRWIGQSAVNPEKLLALELPLPPLSEQQRIVAMLAQQLTAVERARAAIEAQMEAAKALPMAYLWQVFDSAEAREWPREPLGDSCELLRARSIAEDGDTSVLAVTTACLTESGFQPSGVKPARMWKRDAAGCILSTGEILIARSNTPDLVGRVSMFTGTPEGAVATDLTIRIRPTPRILPFFLTGYLSSLYVSGYWKERAGGASGSMKKITRRQILAEQVPIPPLGNQQKIAEVLANRFLILGKVTSSLEAQLTAVNKMSKALLQRAFRGEL